MARMAILTMTHRTLHGFSGNQIRINYKSEATVKYPEDDILVPAILPSPLLTMKMLRFFLAVTFLTFPRCRAKPRPIARMLSSVKESYPGFHPNAIVDVGANMGLWR
jgi:hypothetical protein